MFYQNWARFCSSLQLCAATEALGLLHSSGIFLTSFTSAPGCFISHVTIKVCNKLLTSLQTLRHERERGLLCSQFRLQLERGENGERLRKLFRIPTLFVMFLKRNKSHRCFDCQVRNSHGERMQGSHVGGQNIPPSWEGVL